MCSSSSSSPVLSQHRQALQEDGHDRLVQVGSRGEGLQVHLLLGALLGCAALLVLHYSLGTVNGTQEAVSTGRERSRHTGNNLHPTRLD